jgi:Hydrazine synthase alpha subunit middle domain/Dockerin type I domain
MCKYAVVALCMLALLPLLPAGPVAYDIVYIRAPRAGDTTYVRFPDVFYPTAMPSGSDLILLHANGTEETLYAAGKGAVLDPAVSLDGQWVFFSYIPDASSSGINPQRGLAYGGADLYKINLVTRQVTRLTNQEWTPPTGPVKWSTSPTAANPANTTYLGYGIFNLGACPLPGGKLMFVSSRDSYMSNKTYTTPNLRLYIMDDDGRNVEPIGHMNIGSALHPTVLMDGRVMFASFEGQGVRDQRNWGLWAIWPDGRLWEPLMSAFTEGGAFHFQAQLSDGRIAVTQYYNLNDNGFGTVLAFNSQAQPGSIPFGSPNANDASNPAVQVGLWGPGVPTAFQPRYTRFPFSPQGLINLTAFSHGEDMASSVAQDGGYAGKVTQPSAAPADDLLLVWTPGPANNLNRPTTTPYYDAGIYLVKSGAVVTDYRNLVKIKNDPNYNELQPKAVVPYSAIYGIAQPAQLPFLPNDGSVSSLLPPGTPFGLIGTSSFYNRNTTPGYGSSAYNGLDSLNTSQNGESSNWFEQGADAGKYSNADIYAVRILATEGVAHRSYPNGDDPGFINVSERERLRILGEIPLRKSDAGGQTVLDPQGNPDTSFLAKIPADTPFTFQTLDKNGMVLNMAQTWHMVRPGEVRNNCGGCHAHNKLGVDFAGTAAGQPGYNVVDLTTTTPLLTKDGSGNTVTKSAGRLIADVEYYRDIKPILQRSCVTCHSKNGTAAAGLVLDDTTLVNGYENTYNRLANDANAQWGIPPVIANHSWRQTNSSRYVRTFQSRRSLLVWKVFGQRLDGWANADHPTETTPGNPATLPAGASADLADIDYTGTIMPPSNSGVAALTDDEKMTFARWIDLGAPISSQDPSYKGYFADELKPVLTMSSPRSGSNGSLNSIRVGVFDAYSGIAPGTLSVVANFPVNGTPAGTELGGSFAQSDPSVWELRLGTPLTSLNNGHVVARVKDTAGNVTTLDRWFTIGSTSASRCDLNGDSVVNILDLQVLVNIALGTATGSGDLNRDGRVDLLDLEALIGTLLGIGSCPA